MSSDSLTMTKCMYKRLTEYCNKYNIINKEQYGFQKQKSTTLAVHSELWRSVPILHAIKWLNLSTLILRKIILNVPHLTKINICFLCFKKRFIKTVWKRHTNQYFLKTVKKYNVWNFPTLVNSVLNRF